MSAPGTDWAARIERDERRRAADAERQRQKRRVLVASGLRELRLRVPESTHDTLRDLCQRAVADDGVLAALVAASDGVALPAPPPPPPPPPTEPPRRPAPAVEAAAVLLLGVVAPLPRPLAPAVRHAVPLAPAARDSVPDAPGPDTAAVSVGRPTPTEPPADDRHRRRRDVAVFGAPMLVVLGILVGAYGLEHQRRVALEAELDRYTATVVELLDEVAAYGRSGQP